MSEFEIYEAMMMALDLSVTASMNFVAIVFAYVVAAYVAGKSLPRNVALGTSTAYTLFLIPPFAGTLGNLDRNYDGALHLQAEYPESWMLIDDPMGFAPIAFLFAIPMILGWLGSIYFMHGFIRSKKQTNAT